MSSDAPAEWLPAVHTRSRSLILTLGLVIAVETLALHLWLHQRHAVLAWTLTSLNLLGLVWLVADYRALATAGVRLGAAGCAVRIGGRARGDFAWTAVEQVDVPTWRDLPDATREYLNTARPDDPNLLFTFRTPFIVRAVVGRRAVRQLGVRVTAPERVVEHWRRSSPAAATAGSDGRNVRRALP